MNAPAPRPGSQLRATDGAGTTFAEIFPIVRGAIPPLLGYHLVMSHGAFIDPPALAGGKLAYRLRRELAGHWVYFQGDVIGDQVVLATTLAQTLQTLKQEQPEIFRHAQTLVPAPQWSATPQAEADFVAHGLLMDAHPLLQRMLVAMERDLGTVRVERLYDARGWVVQEAPALAISISSRLVAKQSLPAYLRRLPRHEDALELWVADATSTLKGQIVAISGSVGELRSHLLSLRPRPEIQRLIEQAPAEEQVVQVLAGRATYDYVASGLQLIVRPEDYGRFGVNAQQVSQALHLAPATRAEMVRQIAQVVKDRGLIAQNAYRASASPGAANLTSGATSRATSRATSSTTNRTLGASAPSRLFLTAADVGFVPQIRLGDRAVAMLDERTLPGLLQRHGLYRLGPTYQAGTPLSIGVLSALETTSPMAQASIDRFLATMQQALQRYGVSSSFLPPVRVGSSRRADLERAYNSAVASDPQLLLGLLPTSASGGMQAMGLGRPNPDGPVEGQTHVAGGLARASGLSPAASASSASSAEWGAYQQLKFLAVGQGRASQVVVERTFQQSFALANIILGILSKTGSLPFVLAAPLPYADVVVGIDIARRRKTRLQGSLNATAVARIYLNTGEFLRYVLHDAPLEGETIPPEVLQGLFPVQAFQGKRVVIHRDGLFRGNERETLLEWADSIGATFHLVEVMKTGAPRLYAMVGGAVQQPAKGSALRLSEREAILVSSLPPYKNVTPNPLHLRASAGFPIEQAIHSVLALTLLHHGSLKSPRLPITIHYSDEIAYLALQGIKPKDAEGSIPYWL